MCNWKRWVWPGILATAILTALAMFFHSGNIEQDLTAKAGSQLAADHPWASVELDGRDLTLNGMAPDETDAASALQLAGSAYDVRVARDATTLPPVASPYLFKAVKGENGVTLTGNVPNDKVRAEVVAAAETAMPGIAVTDQMTIARGVPSGYAPLAAFGLGQLANLVSGEVSLSDSDYSIMGAAADSDAYEAELAKANGTLPGDGKLAQAQITAPAVDPYIWSATKAEDNTITLTGFAPDFAAREAAAASAAQANPGATIVNNLKIASGAPEGYAAMTAFGLGQLPKLTYGTASLTGNNYAINGAALTSESFDEAVAEASGSLPGGAVLAGEAITPPVADGAYNWAANKGADGSITLTGLMPDTASRDRIAARAAEVNPGATIINQMRVASGAPDGFVDAADYSLGYLPRFTTGAVNLSNTDMSVKGRAIDGSNFDAAETLEGAAPANFNLAADITLPPATGTYEVVATKSADVVTLTGFAPSNAAKQAIVDAAGGLGVNVVDRITVASGAPEGIDWGAAGAFAVGGLKDISTGTARLSGTSVSIDGDTASGEAYNMAEAAWSGDIAGGASLGTKSIRLPKADPYIWTATRSDRVVLDGVVPSRAVGDEIAREASEFFGTALEVVDGQDLASGQPRGFEAAASVGLAAVSRLEDGVASINGTELTVTGTALTQPAKTDIERKVRNGVPPGFVGVPQIAVKPAPLEPGGLGALAPDLCQLALNSVLSGGQIRFATDEAVIEEASFGILDQLAYTAQQCPNARIEIGGHTDSDGSDNYNQNLSERRAGAVVEYLVGSGVAGDRLSAAGYGESQPIASNDTEEGKSQNRRIEFKIVQ